MALQGPFCGGRWGVVGGVLRDCGDVFSGVAGLAGAGGGVLLELADAGGASGGGFRLFAGGLGGAGAGGVALGGKNVGHIRLRLDRRLHIVAELDGKDGASGNTFVGACGLRGGGRGCDVGDVGYVAAGWGIAPALIAWRLAGALGHLLGLVSLRSGGICDGRGRPEFLGGRVMHGGDDVRLIGGCGLRRVPCRIGGVGHVRRYSLGCAGVWRQWGGAGGRGRRSSNGGCGHIAGVGSEQDGEILWVNRVGQTGGS